VSSSNHSDLTELLEYVDLESWLDYESIDHRVIYGRSGDQANIKTCPRCGGSEWKVYMGIESGIGNCFHGSCVGEKFFNVYTFALNHLGLSPAKTIESLKTFAKNSGYRQRRKSITQRIQGEVKLPDNHKLPINNKNLKYLTNRGFDNEVSKYFDWRYVTSGSYIYQDAKDIQRYQRYDGRVLMPIYDINGVLRTFQGRDITGDSDRKYLFPPGLCGSGRFLYNAYNAVTAERVVLGEGVFDVAAIKCAVDEVVDLRDVVPLGSFGKSLSMASEGDSQLTEFATLKKNGLKEVTFMWDGEKSTIQAAFEAAMKLHANTGLLCKVAVLPKNCDPNEATPEQVRAAFYQAVVANKRSAMKILMSY
jgi:DNA primase